MDKFGPKALVTPGLVLVILSLVLFSQLTASTSVDYIVALHVMMLIGISMVMLPAQTTTGLNQLPKQLYPHGTAIMNTLQQVLEQLELRYLSVLCLLEKRGT
ncbi:MAG: hypothetical protein WCE77_26185 [Priestia megaterium]